MSVPAEPGQRDGLETREAARVAHRISNPRLWQYDYLMLKEIADGLARQAEALKSQVLSEALRLQTTVKQMTAARDAAQLEYVLARTDAAKLDITGEIGKTGLGDQMAGHISEDEKFGTLLDATFELQKVQLQTLRATGGLEKWALAETALPSAGQLAILTSAEMRVSPSIKSLIVALTR